MRDRSLRRADDHVPVAARRRPRTRSCSRGGWRRHVRTPGGLSRLHSYGSLLDGDAPGADVRTRHGRNPARLRRARGLAARHVRGRARPRRCAASRNPQSSQARGGGAPGERITARVSSQAWRCLEAAGRSDGDSGRGQPASRRAAADRPCLLRRHRRSAGLHPGRTKLCSRRVSRAWSDDIRCPISIGLVRHFGWADRWSWPTPEPRR